MYIDPRLFLPTPSARRATTGPRGPQGEKGISTHALREEGDLDGRRHQPVVLISTHALREEGDDTAVTVSDRLEKFLPTPSARRATRRTAKTSLLLLFLPTPSARRATPAGCTSFAKSNYFYPRPPRGGRLGFVVGQPVGAGISTHALREEGDGNTSGTAPLR